MTPHQVASTDASTDIPPTPCATATIAVDGFTGDTLLERLSASEVRLVVDVRQVAWCGQYVGHPDALGAGAGTGTGTVEDATPTSPSRPEPPGRG